MQLLQNGAVAMLAAVGLTTLIWLAATLIFRPRRFKSAVTALLCPGTQSGELEEAVRQLSRNGWDGNGFSRILVVDDGLDEDTRRRALLLMEEDPRVFVCTPEEISGYLTG